MAPKTFIFIGRSGCGKGTQAKILHQQIEQMDGDKKKIMYLETGPRFREFIKGDTYSNKLAAEIANTTARQPDFLAVWTWANVFIEELTGEEHLIIDGTPRALLEAKAFNTAVTFYKRTNPVVIYVDVSRAWSKERLLARHETEGRSDDQLAIIEQRLNWFDEEIYPAVQYFEHHPGYKFIHVNGEQTVEKVSHDILSQLNW
jgi:adenylate kinase